MLFANPRIRAVASRLKTTGPMVGGLVLVGLAGYYLLGIAGRTLSPDDASAVAVLYLVANIVGPGLATAMEQETSRGVSRELALGRTPRLVIQHMFRLAAVAMIIACVVMLVLAPPLVHRAFNERWGLFVALTMCIVTFGWLYLVRGVLAGRGLWSAYAVTLSVEGLARLAPLFLLELIGVSNAVLFGMIFAAGSAFAAISGMYWWRRPDARIIHHTAEPVRFARSFGMLVTAALLMQLVANLAPVVAALRIDDNPALVATLASGVVLARIPLLLLAPVQALLLPSLVQAITLGNIAAVRREIARTLSVVLLLGTAGVVGTWVLGPWVLDTFFGARLTLPAWVLPLLGTGTVIMMAVQVLHPALLAAGRHGRLLVAWIAGAVTLVVVAFLPVDPVIASVAAQVVGPLVVASIAAWTLTTTLAALEARPCDPTVNSSDVRPIPGTVTLP